MLEMKIKYSVILDRPSFFLVKGCCLYKVSGRILLTVLRYQLLLESLRSNTSGVAVGLFYSLKDIIDKNGYMQVYASLLLGLKMTSNKIPIFKMVSL